MNTLMNENSKMAIKTMYVFLSIMLASVLQSIGQVFGMMIVGQLGINALASISTFFSFINEINLVVHLLLEILSLVFSGLSW